MSTYDSHKPPSSFGLLVAIALLGALSLGGVVFWFLQNTGKKEAPPERISAVTGETRADAAGKPRSSQAEVPASQGDGVKKKEVPGMDPPVINPVDSISEAKDQTDKWENPPIGGKKPDVDGVAWRGANPVALLEKVGRLLENAGVAEVPRLVGTEAFEEVDLKTLIKLAEGGRLQLAAPQAVREVGELEANRRVRWALDFDEPKEGRLLFDFLRQKSGDWVVERVRLREKGAPNAAPTDALGTLAFFLDAVFRQEFDEARSVVDSSKVSDARIAALCVIFEDANYQLREKRPLQAMFQRERTAGFIAHVENAAGDQSADFGLSLHRAAPGARWFLAEINLDRLLVDYADRVAGGDVHYTPLVKNPTGGDTLILYFGFDEDGLTPRTRRQLEIVAELLKVNDDKKLTLSGHTDSLGSDEYNEELSARRAGAVENFLIKTGVPPSQLVSFAEGEANPRMPNATAGGEDNPAGRRANRRTEIYLDF